VYVAPVGVLRGYLIDSPYSAFSALRRSASLASVDTPYLLSAYRKPVYLYFTSLDGLASSASTSAVRRYAVSEYGNVYSQYTASNRAFKFEAVERPADWFFRVSPVRRFYEYLQPLDGAYLSKAVIATAGVYEYAASGYGALLASRTYGTYERLYEGPRYSKTVSPLLTSQLLAYRPRRRYTSYAVLDYSQLYSLLSYIKAVLFRTADLEDIYGVPLYKKLSYSFTSAEDVLAVALGAKPVYVSLIDSEPVFDSSTCRLASVAYADYEGLYALMMGVKPVSIYHGTVELITDSASYKPASRVFTEYVKPVDGFSYAKSTSPVLIVQVLAYRPRRRYISFTTSDYARVYEGVKAVKSVVFIVSGLENVYGIPSYVKLSYVFDVISDVLTSVLGVKPIYVQIGVVEQVVDLASYRLASKAYNTYERLYEGFVYSKTVSPLLTFQILTYRPRRRYATYSATGYERVYDGVKAVKAVVVRLGNIVDVYAVSKLVNRSVVFTEFVVPYESFETRRIYVYRADSYEGLYIFNYVPTVRYYNVYFVNVYRYANISDLERLYESFRYEKKSAGYSYTSYERVYEGLGYGRSGYGYASYERLYEGFIAQKG